MATMMIKVAGEGLVEKAHRLADPGPTTGSSEIYEVVNVPDGVEVADVVELVKKAGGKPKHNEHTVEYGDLV